MSELIAEVESHSKSICLMEAIKAREADLPLQIKTQFFMLSPVVFWTEIIELKVV